MRPTEHARLEFARLSQGSSESLQDIFHKACELTAKTLGVARSGLWMFVAKGEALRCTSLYEAANGQWSEGAILRTADFPGYIAALRARKIVPVETALGDPITNELAASYLKPLGISSLLDAPVLVGGEVVGVLCSEHIGLAREWTTEERDFVASVADLLALKMQSAKVDQLREALHDNEKRMQEMERSEALGNMALGIAHDFRSILTSINNCAHALMRLERESETAQDLLHCIVEASRRGADLVKELIDYGRNEPAKPVVFCPGEAIVSFMTILRTAIGGKYRIELKRGPDRGMIMIDRNQFNRVLLNLVMNARDAMANGGTIEVHVEQLCPEKTDNQRFVTISVIDSGTGMSAEVQERIFVPAFSTKEGGSGLGMPIVQRIVNRAGGTISIDSSIGKGTAIRVHLPRIAGEESK